MSENACKIGTFSKSVMLSICRISFRLRPRFIFFFTMASHPSAYTRRRSMVPTKDVLEIENAHLAPQFIEFIMFLSASENVNRTVAW